MSDVKIEMTLKGVIEAAPALNKLMALKMSSKTKYHAAKLGRLLQNEMEIYEERRLSLIKELGADRDATEEEVKRGSSSKIFGVIPDKMEEFQKQHKELLAVKVLIARSPFPFEEIPDDVTALDIMALGALVTEPRP